MGDKPELLFIVGPTASGKSALALSLAQRYTKVELVSIDSAQIYRGMNIGTAKPTQEEQSAVPHHLIDVIDPERSWSVAQFAAAFNEAVADIVRRGGVPIAVGGTMMYVSALLSGLSQVPSADAQVRAEIDRSAARDGWPALHRQLQQCDPQTAARLAPGDAQRISRALEVFRATGKPLSSFQGARAPLLQTHKPRLIVLAPQDRATLHANIAKRFDAMLQAGFVAEVEQLRLEHPALEAQMPSMRCVGYRQVWDYLIGRCSYDEMREQGIAATRQLAKRQLTWQRHQFAQFSPEVYDSSLQRIAITLPQN